MTGTITTRSGLRGHAMRAGASLLLVAVGLLAGLGLAEGPLHATSTAGVGNAQSQAAAPGGEAYLAYRAGERDAGTSTAAAWLSYRAGERDSASSPSAFQAWQAYRAGEREVGQP